MKTQYLFVISFFVINSSIAQLIKAPNIHFSGSKIDWTHSVKDTFETDQISNTFPSFSNKEIGHIWSRPKEFNGKVVFNVSNHNDYYSGTIVSAYDLESGKELWTRNFNPHFENTYGYSYSFEMKKDINSNLVLRGFRSKVPFIGASGTGHYAQKTLDIENGNTINFYNNTKQDIRTWVLTNPAEIKSDFTSFFVYNSWPSSGKFFPILIETKNDTIVDSYEFDTNKTIHIPNLSIDELRNEEVYGPFTKDHLSYTFLVQYEIIGQSPKSFLWKTDMNSNVLEQKEISNIVGEFFFHAEQKDSLIELITTTKDGSPQGHKGYAFIDMDGNIVKKNSQITIDGKKAGHLAINKISGTDEVLLVARFQEDNDIYIYKENKDGLFTKAGHLINPNSNAYAYIPKYIFQTSDHGLVISGSFTMDTVFSSSYKCHFDCGGWPVIMKLSAKTLGITSPTSDAEKDLVSFSISPNPSTDQITVHLPNQQVPVSLYIRDQLGKTIIKQDIMPNTQTVDIAALAPGMYYVSVHDRSSGKMKAQTQKLVKM